MIPTVVWLIFLFALGACVGSFLNVVVYRLPRGLSIVRPASRCCQCERPIAWYDNIPILSWFILGGRCRYCKAPFSIRYAAVELLTALLFVGLYWAYFIAEKRLGMPAFEQGGWIIYVGHIMLVCVLLASSIIDAERMYFELSIIHFAAVAGLILSAILPYVMPGETTSYWQLVPYATPKTAAIAVGSAIGLIVAMVLIRIGILKWSYLELEEALAKAEQEGKEDIEIDVNHRAEMVRELAFLAPVALGAALALWLLMGHGALSTWWIGVIESQKWCAGLLGSVFGFMIGGAVVWATRIFGTLGFGREAMGMGDVHLMAAVGAVLGAVSPTVAFFVAPFFGLGWAIVRLIFHGTREIPYGPFLSAGTLIVLVLQDGIVEYFAQAMIVPQY